MNLSQTSAQTPVQTTLQRRQILKNVRQIPRLPAWLRHLLLRFL